MMTEPKLEHHDEQPFVAIRERVTMQDFASVIDRTFPEVLGWLEKQGAAPDGPPFIRYIVIDMEKGMEVEMGWLVSNAMTGEGRVWSGTLPAGTYAMTLYTGHYSGLQNATADLLAWAEKNDIAWQTSGERNDTVWAARLEFYLTDPRQEPDPEKWETKLAFLLAEDKNATGTTRAN